MVMNNENALEMRVYHRLIDKFGVAFATAALFMAPACAQDTGAPNAETVAETNCAVVQDAISPPEAIELSNYCDAVIYFNENASAFQAEADARSLRDENHYSVVAVAGFPGVDADQIVVLRNGSISRGGIFTNSDMLRGAVRDYIRREMGDHTEAVDEALADHANQLRSERLCLQRRQAELRARIEAAESIVALIDSGDLDRSNPDHQALIERAELDRKGRVRETERPACGQ